MDREREEYGFVGYEEGGGDLPEMCRSIDYFYNNHSGSKDPTLCDIRDLYKHVYRSVDGPKSGVFKTLYDYRFGPNAIHTEPGKIFHISLRL